MEVDGAEVHAVGTRAQPAVADATTQRLRGYADQWRPIVGLSDQQVTDAVRQDQIDVPDPVAGRTCQHFQHRSADIQRVITAHADQQTMFLRHDAAIQLFAKPVIDRLQQCVFAARKYLANLTMAVRGSWPAQRLIDDEVSSMLAAQIIDSDELAAVPAGDLFPLCTQRIVIDDHDIDRTWQGSEKFSRIIDRSGQRRISSPANR